MKITIEGYEDEPIVFEETDDFALYVTGVEGFDYISKGGVPFLGMVSAHSQMMFQRTYLDELSCDIEEYDDEVVGVQ